MRALRKVIESWFIDSLIIVGGVLLLWTMLAPELPMKALSLLRSKLIWDVDFDKLFLQTIKNLSVAISLRIVLIISVVVLAIVGVFARLIWRLRKHKRFTGTTCPSCEYPLSRVKRTPIQKALGNVLPIRRYYCAKCGWKGIRLKDMDGVALELLSQKPARTKPVEKISNPSASIN